MLWIALAFLAVSSLQVCSHFPRVHLAWHWAWTFTRSASHGHPKSLFHLPLSTFYLIFIFFGAAWYQFRQPNIDAFHIAFYNDRDYEMLVTGTLSEPPDYRDTYTNLRLKVEAVDSGRRRPARLRAATGACAAKSDL